MTIQIAILVASDRVSAGIMTDRGGDAIEVALAEIDAHVIERAVVPDDRAMISNTLRQWADDSRFDIILTTGGTGLGPRDVTADATADVCERLVPGIAEAIRASGMTHTPHAMLSRAIAGIRGRTLIINLPGSPTGAAEGVAAVVGVLDHAVTIMHGGKH